MRNNNKIKRIYEGDELIGVIVPIKEWRKMEEDLDAIEDIVAYIEAKNTPMTFTPIDESFKEIKEARVKQAKKKK